MSKKPSLYSIDPVDYDKITNQALNGDGSDEDPDDEEAIDDFLNSKRKKREKAKPNNKKTKLPEKKNGVRKSRTAEIVLDDEDDGNLSSSSSSKKSSTINRNPTIPFVNDNSTNYTPTPAGISESRMLLQRLRTTSGNVSGSNFNPNINTNTNHRNIISIDDDEPAVQETLQSHIDFECVSDFAAPLLFKMLKTDTLDKMFRVYCLRNKISDYSSITFKWFGVKLDLHKTPNDVGMTDKEKINVVKNYVYNHDSDTNSQSSSTLEIPSPSSTATSSTYSSSTNSIQSTQGPQIILKVQYNEEEWKFRVRKSDPLQKILDGVCEKASVRPNQIKLMFDGRALSLRETPGDLDMEDDDQIDAHDVK